MADIFMSHAGEDGDLAIAIAHGLEAVGYTTWYYERDSRGIIPYTLQIRRAITDAQIILLIISVNSLGSHEMTTELRIAHRCGKGLCPLLVGIAYDEVPRREEEWDVIIGTTTAVDSSGREVDSVVAQIVEDLRSAGIRPSGSQGSSAQDPSTAAAPNDGPTVDTARPKRLPRPLDLLARRWWVVAVCIVALVATGALYLHYARSAHVAVNATIVLSAAEAGDWDRATQLLSQGLSAQPNSPHLNGIREQLADAIQVELEFHSRLRSGTEQEGQQRTAMTSGDGYYVVLDVPRTCYLYLLHRDSSGRFRKLFPASGWSSTSNPVEPGDYRVPEATGEMQLEAGVTGLHTLYVLGAPWRQVRLEQLLSEAEGEDPVVAEQAALAIEQLLASAEKHTAELPGLAYADYGFDQVASGAYGHGGASGRAAGDCEQAVTRGWHATASAEEEERKDEGGCSDWYLAGRV